MLYSRYNVQHASFRLRVMVTNQLQNRALMHLISLRLQCMAFIPMAPYQQPTDAWATTLSLKWGALGVLTWGGVCKVDSPPARAVHICLYSTFNERRLHRFLQSGRVDAHSLKDDEMQLL